MYKRTPIPVIGGIAECIEGDSWATKGNFYLIDDYGEGGFPSIIGDDGERCGVHAYFSNRKYYYYVSVS